MVSRLWGRQPFDNQYRDGLSDNLQMDPNGTLDGHNTLLDSTLMDTMRVDQRVPLSPLFVRDLTGRVIYIGSGPEVKNNDEWQAYQLYDNSSFRNANPFVPLVVFPRFCRDVAKMPGRELLEQVFLTKFRCLEMSMGYNGIPSSIDEDLPSVAITYPNANLYPYKLRLDTFYTDGWKLPQTSMVYARGENMDVDVPNAGQIGERFMAAWRNRETGLVYEDWIERMGKHEMERMFEMGCTVIPTFEACNGFHVVGRDFSLQDYWPGRVVLGLHDVIESQVSQAPAGTILQVVTPGYVTADRLVKAQVIVSDGSQYVSPNAEDTLPLIPNLNLPHTRMAADWGLCWIPTHPAHFEAPALWGWDVDTGRFLQVSGPLWDPLHYYYASVDEVLASFENYKPGGEWDGYVRVPDHMMGRFYPVTAMSGFDVMVYDEYSRRVGKGGLVRSCLKRVRQDTLSCEIGYHPLPPEFEFEIDPFWFPELHPANRDFVGFAPEMQAMIMPVVETHVSVGDYVANVDTPAAAEWMRDEKSMAEPDTDPLMNYPFLVRYLVADMRIEEILTLCPLPFLSDQRDMLTQSVQDWWKDERGHVLDSARALDGYMSGVHDALWEMRERGVELVKFRHMIYQVVPPIYILGWWSGAAIIELEAMFADWIEQGEAADKQAEDEVGRPRTADENKAFDHSEDILLPVDSVVRERDDALYGGSDRNAAMPAALPEEEL